MSCRCRPTRTRPWRKDDRSIAMSTGSPATVSVPDDPARAVVRVAELEGRRVGLDLPLHARFVGPWTVVLVRQVREGPRVLERQHPVRSVVGIFAHPAVGVAHRCEAARGVVGVGDGAAQVVGRFDGPRLLVVGQIDVPAAG